MHYALGSAWWRPMSSLLLLSLRRWRSQAKAHLASATIAAAVMTAWLIYWGYLEYMGLSISGRILTNDVPADFAITLPPGAEHSVPDGSAEALQAYQALMVETPIGMQSLAAVYSSGLNAPLPDPQKEEVWLAETLRIPGITDVGRPFRIAFLEDWRYRVFEGRVAGFYSPYDGGPSVVVNGYWIGSSGSILDANEVILYQWSGNSLRWAGHLPDRATMETTKAAAQMAAKVVDTTFSGGGRGVGLLFVLLVLGVGTFCLLSYMDSRRELALLKSMGLRPGEIGWLFALESLLTGMIALGLTMVAILVIDIAATLPVSLSGSMIMRAVMFSIGAFAAAIAVPCMLTKEGSVNELLLNRPIPLLRYSVVGVRRIYPTLVPLLEAGYKLVKLPTVDGGFPGICMRKAGQEVKAAETVAWMASAWGLIEHHFLAPCDGDVIRVELDQGILVIKPH